MDKSEYGIFEKHVHLCVASGIGKIFSPAKKRTANI